MLRSKVLVLFALIAVSAGLAMADDKPFEHEVYGTVISTDGDTDTIVVRLDDGMVKTFKYDSTLDVLNIGRDDYVVVRYNDDSAGNLMAVKIDEADRTMRSTYNNRSLSGDNELPRTASPLPLLALMGLGSLISGFALRRNRNRNA